MSEAGWRLVARRWADNVGCTEDMEPIALVGAGAETKGTVA
ncbi:MAG TPA: hypothetical protein VII47_13615 [Actinomycetota bacterium]